MSDEPKREERNCLLCGDDKRRRLFEVRIFFEEKKEWEKWFFCSKCLKHFEEKKPRRYWVVGKVNRKIITLEALLKK